MQWELWEQLGRCKRDGGGTESPESHPWNSVADVMENLGGKRCWRDKPGDFSGSVFSSALRERLNLGETGTVQREEKFGELCLLFFLCGILAQSPAIVTGSLFPCPWIPG